jgi:hypothetical protein
VHDEKTLQEFDRWGKARPTSEGHGTPEEIRANLKRAQCSNWRLEGNVLYADTDFGPLVQTIPTNYICRGTDSEGLPILAKLSL